MTNSQVLYVSLENLVMLSTFFLDFHDFSKFPWKISRMFLVSLENLATFQVLLTNFAIFPTFLRKVRDFSTSYDKCRDFSKISRNISASCLCP